MPQALFARSHSRPTADAQLSPWRRLTQIAFVLSVALVVCRLLMPETTRSPSDALAGLTTPNSAQSQAPGPLASAHASRDPGPATGLVLDLLACLPALLLLARRALDKHYELLTAGSMLPMALLAILAALSPLWAADRFASVISAAHLFCALVFLWSTFQLVRSWHHLRLIAGALLGLLIALALVGYNFRLVEMPYMRESFNKEKEAVLTQHNIKPGTFQAQMFENRIVQGQPMGYRVSPNTYAALLVMLGVIAAGIVIQHRADGDHWIWILVPLIAVAAIFPLIRWTLCRAAYATPVLGAMILLAVWAMRGWLARWSRAAYFIGVSVIAGCAVFVVHHGMRYGTLGHDSLDFRWNYWVGSFKILTDGFYHASRQYFHFIFGVGWENFGPYYLGQRLAIAPEEIRDPHNFVVRVFVELGMLGGILLLAWMLRLAWDLTRPAVPAETTAPDPSPSNVATAATAGLRTKLAPSNRSLPTLLPLAAIALTATTLNIAAATDFNSDSWFIVLELSRAGLFFCVLVLSLMVIALRMSRQVTADRSGTINLEADERPARWLRAATARGPGELSIEPDKRPAPWLLYAMLAALATFLVHNLIEFSLFEPGPMFLFALITGAVLSLRAQGRRQTTAVSTPVRSFGLRAVRIGWAAALLGWLVAAICLVTPVVMAESLAQDADADILAFVRSRDSRSLIQAAKEISEAARMLPYNADYAHRAAALMYGSNDPQRVKQLLDTAIAADPTSVRDLLLRAQLEMDLLHDVDAGLADYRRAVSLDPRNVRMRLGFATALTGAARQTHRASFAKEAALEYERALDDNNQLVPEEVKRLTPNEMEAARKGAAEANEIARGG